MRVYKITVVRADGTVLDSAKLNTYKECMEAAKILMKPSMFGTTDFKITLETLWEPHNELKHL